MRVLVARPDSNGDVLLAEPAIRSVAQEADVDLLVSEQGLSAASMISGVGRLLVHQLPWIDADPEPLSAHAMDRLIQDVKEQRYDQAIVLTSYHQSALPLALILRLAGVPWIAARSEDYPGSLLDLRLQGDPDIHEVERSLSLTEAAGFRSVEDRRIRLEVVEVASPMTIPYVVVHPGGTAPARRWSADRWRNYVALLSKRFHVVVTGDESERELTSFVAADVGDDLGGKTTFTELAALIDNAAALVSGNTSVVHLASAFQTPVVVLFAPVVPAKRWGPWLVPYQLLGDQSASCRGSRVRHCSVPGHPCLNSVTADEALESTLYLIGES